MKIVKSSDGREIWLADRYADYCGEVSRLFDSMFNTLKETSPGVLDLSEQRVHTYIFDGKRYLIPSLPEESPIVLDYFRHFTPSSSSYILDLGAYCGVWTVWAAKQVYRVIALEPDERNRRCLEFNIFKHAVDNVTILSLAADHDGRVEFNDEGTIGSAIPSRNYRGSFGDTTWVDGVSLRTLFESYGRPDFIKMDVEGSEVQLLKDAGILLKGIPIAVDTNHHAPHSNSGCTKDEVERLLKESGHRVESSNEAWGWTTWGF